jgi:hypothetical protein
LFKLLEGIGAISSSECITAERTNFQENVTSPLNREFDNDAVVQEDPPENDSEQAIIENGSSVLSAIEKVQGSST